MAILKLPSIKPSHPSREMERLSEGKDEFLECVFVVMVG
jgi:hypothetical protein